ncbi:MAG: CHAD domain-containing protein [Pseudomonadota bacterium]
MTNAETSAQAEVELKFDFDRADHDTLVAALRTFGSKTATHRLISTYFDTPQSDIAQAGYVLRVRRAGAQRTQTIKTLGAGTGLFARSEWERRLDGDRPDPASPSEPLAAAVGGEELARIRPAFVTDIRRTVIRVDYAGAVIDAALDAGEIRCGARATEHCELELELHAGDSRTLFALARALSDDVPLRLGVCSKAERGYALAQGRQGQPVKAGRVVLDPGSGLTDAFALIVRACIRQFRMNEDGLAQSGDAEAIHQARVALRRLRSAFAVFERMLDGDAQVGPLDQRLRTLAAALGTVRNIDVLIPHCHGGARERLRVAREAAWGRARAVLARPSARCLMLDLAEWLEFGDWRLHPAHPRRLRESLPAFAARSLDDECHRLARRSKKLPNLGRKRRHRARIEAKKMRYATDFFGSLYSEGKSGRRLGTFQKNLDLLQLQLGKLNDLAVGHRLAKDLKIHGRSRSLGRDQGRTLVRRAVAARHMFLQSKRFW